MLNESQNLSNGNVKLTGLWENKTKDGKRYLGGTLGNLRISVFKNENKRNPNEPDYELIISNVSKQNPRQSPGQSRQEQAGRQQPQAKPSPQAVPHHAPQAKPEAVEEIDFAAFGSDGEELRH